MEGPSRVLDDLGSESELARHDSSSVTKWTDDRMDGYAFIERCFRLCLIKSPREFGALGRLREKAKILDRLFAETAGMHAWKCHCNCILLVDWKATEQQDSHLKPAFYYGDSST